MNLSAWKSRSSSLHHVSSFCLDVTRYVFKSARRHDGIGGFSEKLDSSSTVHKLAKHENETCYETQSFLL